MSNGILTKEEAIQYATWVIHECDSPIDELEWLVSKIPPKDCNDIRDNVLKFLDITDKL